MIEIEIEYDYEIKDLKRDKRKQKFCINLQPTLSYHFIIVYTFYQFYLIEK